MTALPVNSFTMNFAHIVTILKNTSSALVKITIAYINGLISSIVNLVKIDSNAVGAVILLGTFLAINKYSVKLGTIFSTKVIFHASL